MTRMNEYPNKTIVSYKLQKEYYTSLENKPCRQFKERRQRETGAFGKKDGSFENGFGGFNRNISICLWCILFQRVYKTVVEVVSKC